MKKTGLIEKIILYELTKDYDHQLLRTERKALFSSVSSRVKGKNLNVSFTQALKRLEKRGLVICIHDVEYDPLDGITDIKRAKKHQQTRYVELTDDGLLYGRKIKYTMQLEEAKKELAKIDEAMKETKTK